MLSTLETGSRAEMTMSREQNETKHRIVCTLKVVVGVFPSYAQQRCIPGHPVTELFL